MHKPAPERLVVTLTIQVDTPTPAESWSRNCSARRGLRRSRHDSTLIMMPVMTVV
jgi:hypothetical protein